MVQHLLAQNETSISFSDENNEFLQFISFKVPIANPSVQVWRLTKKKEEED